MTEIEKRDEQQAIVPAAQPAPSELMQWVESARQAHLVAQSLANTSFAGQFKGKPDEITAVILTGQELGLQPMASLKSIDVIQGQPALRAHAMRAIVQSHGHEVELVESTDVLCIMRGRRKGDGDEEWQTVEWPIERAQRLGLLGKDQWKKQPKTMLVARATGEICRLIASDALHGVPYASEELDAQAAAPTYKVTQAPRMTPADLLGTPPPAAPEPAAADVEPDSDWEPADDAA